MALFRIGFVLFPRLTQLDLTGSPERAGPELVERIRRAAEPMLRERDAAVARAAKALEGSKP
jgi:hypothetical protein